MTSMHVKAQVIDHLHLELTVDGHTYELDHDRPQSSYQAQATTPAGALLVGLAGCKLMLAQSYLASRHIEGVTVSLDLEANLGRDDQRQRNLQADIRLNIEGDLTDKQQENLQRYVDSQCAVEQIILSESNQIQTHYQFN
ncbi:MULTISPECIES: OsmC family protein [Aerococcus]|uniref:OsmC family protein n=1 Tax=Aerococcus sanguinicola TaxID=119206 RepID=A0A5N1GLN5_9LACT|nr:MULTISPECIES: OsmC family protein [Aerococcus]KAA9301903.1 OsmC family protein [Aerococcus sanguinicola]MDK6368674.1 OsmC family protein [Aerococcus sp. UMB9870]MDK6679757.1 OsmC family protein [Aerococcus sp. UMB8608]MDK6685972.1 OsmC family protein [Aerococcus sp. UMB8623]MDK6940777.1 OsmC family protein [Aerococcus sp. UMB8487]